MAARKRAKKRAAKKAPAKRAAAKKPAPKSADERAADCLADIEAALEKHGCVIHVETQLQQERLQAPNGNPVFTMAPVGRVVVLHRSLLP